MAVYSMTGFGEGRADSEGVEVTVELKTVNHRFLDIVFRMPASYSRFEPEAQKALRAGLKRGRVEVNVTRSSSTEGESEIVFHAETFSSYLAAAEDALRRVGGLPRSEVLPSLVQQALGRREILEFVAPEAVSKTDMELELALFSQALEQALTSLLEMRKAEGKALAADMRAMLKGFSELVEQIEKVIQSTPIDFKEKLTQRLERLLSGGEVDPERLAQEVAVFADRVDVSEEISRLKSHLSQMDSLIKQGEGGRKCEFLLQEFGREVNTIGSKAQNSECTALVVEAKAVLEKLREQVQNME